MIIQPVQAVIRLKRLPLAEKLADLIQRPV
jgi:hypothetical protein